MVLPMKERGCSGPSREERGGSSTRARALEADLARVEFVAREVRVRRIVVVEPPNARVAEDDATTPVRLEAVLVRIDRDRVGAGKGINHNENGRVFPKAPP